ncbi:uncharacterized protein LOC144552007 isoform X1 [Carex rostrata]
MWHFLQFSIHNLLCTFPEKRERVSPPPNVCSISGDTSREERIKVLRINRASIRNQHTRIEICCVLRINRASIRNQHTRVEICCGTGELLIAILLCMLHTCYDERE